jgi:O-antigen ligase
MSPSKLGFRARCQQWRDERSRQAWIAALVLAFPLCSLATGIGVGLVSFLFFVTALWYWRDSWDALRLGWTDSRWVILAFAAQLAFMVFYMLTRGRNPAVLESSWRMLMAATAMLAIQCARPGSRPLWWGIWGGALAAAAVAAWQRWVLDLDRAGGYMNPITFGDLSLVLALLSLASMLDVGAVRRSWGPALGALGGFAGSLLSGSRGGWLVLPFAIALFIMQRRTVPRRLAVGLPLLACAMVLLAWFVPGTGVRERVDVGLHDLSLYLNGNPLPTSLSVRLELWKAALMLAREHPLLGIETAHYKAQMQAWIATGQLKPWVFAPPEPPHLHNDILQVLVTRGIPGLVFWIPTLLAPLLFFVRHLRLAPGPGAHYAAALAGVLLVLAYFCFGLTEVIFWSRKASAFYAVLVFVLMGFCLNAQATRATPPHPPRGAQDRPDSRPAGTPSHRQSRAEKS